MTWMIRIRRTLAASVGLVALTALGSPPAGAQLRPVPNLPGTELLSEIDHVVVVYPAGTGADVEINRLSGQRRAGFLHYLFGYETEFVADDEVTEAQLHQHLLVLGWNNRLLDKVKGPKLFAREGEDWRFLKSLIVGPDEDLMFAVASPFDPRRRLFFWTRIDLELDKFSVLPFLGSDWAIYRGYEVVAQGMFENARAWPPVRDYDAEMSHGDVRLLYQKQGSSEHYTIHYPKDLITPEQRDAILAARERALAKAVADLGRPASPLKIDLYLFADLKTKEELSGVPDPMHSLGRSMELFMLPRDAVSDSPHEEVHLVAQQLLGPCHHTALHEGLAMVAGREEGAQDLSVYAAAIVEQDAVPSIAELLDEEGIRELNRRGLGFPASGLFVEWILEQGGTATLKQVYSSRPLTVQQLAQALGTSPDAANASFREHVVAAAQNGASEFRFHQARADAKRLSQNGDWSGSADRLAEALELRPGDRDTMYTLALAEIRAGRLEQAETVLRRLLEVAGKDEASPSRYLIFGHYQLGQVLEKTGRTALAGEEYRTVLDLPDRYDSHKMAREGLLRVSSSR
jgi:tetratricopeptide (TPR) repeat protein